MDEIMSGEDLEAWLREHDRADFAQVIAARCALRVLPYALTERVSQPWDQRLALAVFRATAISWAARNFPAHDMAAAARAALYAAADAADAAAARAALYAAAAAAARAAAAAAAAAARAALYAAADAAAARAAARAAAAAAARAAAAAAAAAAAFWRNVRLDCRWLDKHQDKVDAVQGLSGEALWRADEIQRWKEKWASAADGLIALDASYQVWIDWYNRRVDGRDEAFDIPGDIDRREDKAVLAKLAAATDDGFWGKGAQYVNTTLQRWIDEARERAAANADDIADPEAQNRDVISFRRTESGQFDPDFEAGTGELLTDPAACDRHLAFVSTAREALSLCGGHNQIGHVAEHLKIVIEAAGDHPRTMRVDLLVARGERMVADAKDAVDELQPDPEAALILKEKRIINVLQALVRDYTAMIKLDPALDRRQRLPDEDEGETGLVSKRLAIAFVNSSLTIGAITQASHDIIIEGAQGLPEKASSKDRRQWRFSEMVRNLPRSMIGFLWGHRHALVGSSVAGVTGVSMALITQEAAIRSFFATNPGMLRVIDELVSIIRTIGM